MKTIIPVVKCEPVKLSYPTSNSESILRACGYELMDARLKAESYVMSNGLLTVFTNDTHHNIACDSFVEAVSEFSNKRIALDLSRIKEAHSLLEECYSILEELDNVSNKAQRFVGNNLQDMSFSTMSAPYFKSVISDLVDAFLEQRDKEIIDSIKLCPYIEIPNQKAVSIDEAATFRLIDFIYTESLKELAYSNGIRIRDSGLLHYMLANDLHHVKFKVAGTYKVSQPEEPKQPTTKKWYHIF